VGGTAPLRALGASREAAEGAENVSNVSFNSEIEYGTFKNKYRNNRGKLKRFGVIENF